MKTLLKIFILSLILYVPISAEKLKIGVSVPLTGAGASYGTDIKNALIFANEKVADNQYELIIEDDHCSDRQAVDVAKKLVNINKVKYMLGFGCSGTVLSSAPVYNKAKVVVIASGTGAPKITDAGDYIFRTKPTLLIAGQKIYADMAKKFSKVGIISEETAYCQGLGQAVIDSNHDSKIEIINKNYLPGTRNFKQLILSLKSKGVQAVFLNPQGDDGLISMYKDLLTLNWDTQVYGTFMPGGKAFLETFKEKADGVIFADVPFNEQMLNDKGLKMYKEFVNRYGAAQSNEHFVTLSYASFSTLHDALQSGQDVKTYLYNNRFSNIIDDYAFDHNGDVVSEKITYLLKTIRNGQVVEH